jgi:hypothetical protein
MSENYFSKLPVFTYSNTACVDITRRTIIANTIQQDLFAYFPYELKGHQRPDTIAERYYKDPSMNWLVYLSNKVVDPYYSFPLDETSFASYINGKYQNFANAQQLILFWRMNWSGSTDDQITPGFYETSIPEPLKKYYEAVYGEETRIVFYRRRREDWKASTNMMIYFNISNTSGSFLPNEVVKLTLPPANTVLSNSYVTFSNTTQVTTQHVMGNVSSNATNMYLRGMTSNTTANVTSIVHITNNISQAEMVYWAPVYAYDYEVEQNEQKKFIRLIDSKYSMPVAEKLRKEMLK